MLLRNNSALARLTAIFGGAAIQVFVVLVVALVWRRTAGHWGPGAWVIYLAAFGLAAPVVGLWASNRVGQWRLTTRQFAASTILLILPNVVFGLMEPGLAEAGISPLASLGGYSIVLLGLFATLSTQKQGG